MSTQHTQYLMELHTLTLAARSYALLTRVKFMRISYSYRMAKPFFGQHILTSFAYGQQLLQGLHTNKVMGELSMVITQL